MGKALVIVESPAKAKTISKYLGRNFWVRSSVGHIRDLPKSGKGNRGKKRPTDLPDHSAGEVHVDRQTRAQQALIRRMGVDPENGWTAQYEILPDKAKVISELRKAAKDADSIYLATDLDREGEAIAWHLQEVIDGRKEKFKRVTFAEITKRAIQEAFANPGVINMNRVRAQQARRFLDRVVGFMLSPLLWKKVARSLSAGRVQSVAVRLITEREKEIHAFVPKEYWEIHADLKDRGKLRAKVVKYRDETFRPSNGEEAKEAKVLLEKAIYRVIKREDKPTRKKPLPPFITSTLQQTSSFRLGFGVKKTMLLAQRLYEAGHITYMRTDSTNLSNDAVNSCRNYIRSIFGEEYLPQSMRVYKSSRSAQEAHEAIRPSDVNVLTEHLHRMDQDQQRLYDLVWRRFVACQMNDAEYDATSIQIEAGDYLLKTSGRVTRFDGWMKVLPPIVMKGEEDVVLPELTVGEVLRLEGLELTQHFTKPPPRYNEASLVRELERRGIGRPSTYAAIISTIQKRGYVRLEKRRFYAEKMGDIVTERLLEFFDEIMDYNFTASLEEQLDFIAKGEMDWREALDRFYSRFKRDLEIASRSMKRNKPTLTDIPCPTCGRRMSIRNARTGVFLGCSGYDLPVGQRCKGTMNLIRGEEVETVGDEDGEARVLLSKHRCPKCGTAMDSYLIDESRKLHICGNNPDCNGFIVEQGKFKLKGYDGPVIVCDKCGADMELKTGRYGKFFSCVRYPECTNTRKLLRNGEPAPPKIDPVPMPELKCEKSEGHFILRDGAAGLFLASSLFPKSRETRSPAVEDLARHRGELDPKYHYLADAPQRDPEGNRVIIRFNRKEKFHYLASESNGKTTGWKAFFNNGQWIVPA
jgi:DNA topoisomerase-1